MTCIIFSEENNMFDDLERLGYAGYVKKNGRIKRGMFKNYWRGKQGIFQKLGRGMCWVG